MIVAKWNTQSAVTPMVSPGLLHFIVHEFGLLNNPTKSVTLYTQYKRDDTIFRCHPNYRGGAPWYDWVMMLYSNPNHPNQQLHCPARLMAIVQDDDDETNEFHPVVQWAGHRTNNDSVLFDEYVFQHDLNPDKPTSFNVHPSASIEKPVFVIDCESEDDNKILVATDPEEWADRFL